MSDRQFKDCDGDTWTEFEPGRLRLTKRANGSPVSNDCECSIEDARDDHGPLTEVRPDVDVRAQVVADLRTKAARDWPGIGVFLEDIIAIVERGPNGEPVEG
jgi:hypothetical protein